MRHLTFRMIAAILTAAFATPLAAQTDTTFTYQGVLNDGGQPASGSYDVTVSLWDAVVGGNQVGSTVPFNGLSMMDGHFTIHLDFGADAFDNNGRWLEITVGGTTLIPRQPITRAPYSIQTRGIFVDGQTRVGIGTTSPSPETELHVSATTHDNFGVLTDSFGVAGTEIGLHTSAAGYSSLVKNGFWAPGWRRFEGNLGAFLEEIDPKGNVFFNVAAPGVGFIDWNTAMMFQGETGRVGIGTTLPDYPLHVASDAGNAIFGRTTEGFSSGVYGMVGAATGRGSGVRGETLSADGIGVIGRAVDANGVNYGVQGFSFSPNGYDFYAGGVGVNYGASSSRRWKTNIVPIEDPLEKLFQLQGVYFDWDTEHGGQHDLGMIAEDVGAVLPEIVQYEENGIDAHGMDYSKLGPLLVEAVNALRAKNNRELAGHSGRLASIESENEELRTENADLKSRLSQLEAIVDQLATQRPVPQGAKR